MFNNKGLIIKVTAREKIWRTIKSGYINILNLNLQRENSNLEFGVSKIGTKRFEFNLFVSIKNKNLIIRIKV